MLDLVLLIFVFVFSFVVGYLLISKVPPRLHTPLMSMTNAVSGITILGAILLFTVQMSALERTLGIVAVLAGVFNFVGGFAITDRMLRLFKRKDQPQ